MKTSRDRILTTHVGSLPRPAAVVDLLEARDSRAGRAPADFDREIRSAVMEAVHRQVDIGIDIVSDGEMSKISYATYVRDRLSGFAEDGGTEGAKPHLDLQPFPNLQRKMAALSGPRRFKRVACVGPVTMQERASLQRDLINLRDAADGTVDVFMNAASPGVVASFLPNAYYPTHDAYIEAVGEAMREEYEAIVGAGVVVQIDCPDLAMSRHTAFQALSEAEFLNRAAVHVEVLNHALRNIPADMVRVHICWGNYEGPHTHDIELRKILKVVLAINAQAISLEAANPRHGHDWAIWQDVELPDDKILLPGVIDTSTNYVEHPDLVADRIIRIANVVGRERVIASTDCGFGTSAYHGKVDPDVAYLKLGVLVEGASRASAQLWA